MSKAKFDDNCPGCRPVVLGLADGKPLGPEHPVMVAVDRVWSHTTVEERKAFHEFTCHNSRDPQVLEIVKALNQRIQFAVNVMGN